MTATLPGVRLRCPLVAALAAATVITTAAQSVAPPPANDTDPIELSPFVVNPSNDNSYAPLETLSGTGLRAQVKDIASAMTIATADFMNDIGALDYNDVVNFMPSAASYATNEDDVNGNGSRTGDPIMVRGYRADLQSTNSFSSLTASDTYNSSRFTFTRGPNILFGIGSPGGGLNATTNKASLNRNFYRLDLRGDSFGGYRAAVDANVPLVRHRAALRLDLLRDDRGNNITPSKNQRNSIFGALTIAPFRNATIYMEVESTHVKRQVPRTQAPFDWVNPWISYGRPIIPVAQRTTAVPGVRFLASDGYLIFVPGVGAMDWSRMGYGAQPQIRGAFTTATKSISYGMNTPNRVVPLDRYIAGDSDRVRNDNENYSLLYQHKLLEGVFLEVGAKHEHYYKENFDGDGKGFSIQVDPNAQLPNGRPNPYVGVPYNEQEPKWEKSGSNLNQFRAQLSWKKDLRHVRLFNQRLGHFTLAGLYNNLANHNHFENWHEVNTTPLPGSTSDLSSARNAIYRRWYFAPGNVDYFATDYAPIDENGIKSGWLITSAPRNTFTRTQTYALAGQANLLEERIALSGGLRRDEVASESTSFARNSRGVFDGAWAPGSRSTPRVGVGRSHMIGVVVHAHRNVSLFYNRSTNYHGVNQTAFNIENEPLPPQTGHGFDTGVKLFLWGERLMASLNYFETRQIVTDSAIRGSKVNWINAIWTALDPAKRIDPSFSDTKEQNTDGIELELVGNPTKNIRLMANVSKNHARAEEQGNFTFPYLEANYAAWQARSTTAVSNPNGRTVGELVALLQQEESDDRQAIGLPRTRVFEWQANFVGRYEFTRVPALRGLALGTAVRWRSAPIIGFARTGRGSTAGLNSLLLLDGSRPFRGYDSTNVDAWLEYNRTLSAFGRDVRWRAQLRVQNVWDDRTLQPWTAEDDGTGRAIIMARRTPGARQFVLSSSFSF